MMLTTDWDQCWLEKSSVLHSSRLKTILKIYSLCKNEGWTD